jgi:hypothetical protein
MSTYAMPRPLDVAIGALAGGAGTLAMDALWFRRFRRDGGEKSFGEWELSTGATSFDDVGAPAKVGQKVARALGRELPDRHAGFANDVVHWSTGASWGMAAGMLAGAGFVAALPAGVIAGVSAFTTAYAVLAAVGIYKPIWQYDAETLWKDASAHIIFGVVTGTATALLRRLAHRP